MTTQMKTGTLPEPIRLLGVNIHPVQIKQLLEYIADVVASGRKSVVLNVNAHCMNLACENQWLHSFLNSAEMVFCDGEGVRLAAKLQGQFLPERITYADWLWQLAAFAEPRELTFYFLGARPGVAASAADKMKSIHRDLRILGVHHGYFDQSADSLENYRLIEEINQLRPNILVVGMGMPLQEQWLVDNWDNINANVALTGGAVFDYVSGELRRAPGWMTGHGLEWLGRLFIEPRRLWRRYIVGNPLFLLRVIRSRRKLI